MKETELRFLINKEKFTELQSLFKITTCTKYEQVFFIGKPKQQLHLRSTGANWQLRLKTKTSTTSDIESEFAFPKDQLENILYFCRNLGYNKLFVISKNRYQTNNRNIEITLDHFLEPELFVVELELQDTDNIALLFEFAKELHIEDYLVKDIMKLKKQLQKSSKFSYNLSKRNDFNQLLNLLNL